MQRKLLVFTILWDNIFALFDKSIVLISEFDNTRASAPDMRVRNISNKLCVIGKLYCRTDRYFPLGKLSDYCNTIIVNGYIFEGMFSAPDIIFHILP